MTGLMTMMRARLVLLLGALLLFSPALYAQNEEARAGARAAADEGGKAFEAGKFSESLDLFSRAESLVHALPHLLYIARSHEKLGQLVAARETYLKITREKLADGAPDAFRDAQQKAQTELAALEPRLAKVTIVVKGEGAESAKVQMDGADVPAALVGIPVPVDPGEHKFVATTAGATSGEKTQSFTEGGAQTVELELVAGQSAVPGGETGGNTSGKIDESSLQGTNGLRIGSYVAFGVGVVGLVGGTVFSFSAKSKRDDASALCNVPPDNHCPGGADGDKVRKLDSDADSARTLSIVGFVVGGVGIATGVTLFVLSNNKKSTARTVTPWVGLGSAGVSGRF